MEFLAQIAEVWTLTVATAVGTVLIGIALYLHVQENK